MDVITIVRGQHLPVIFKKNYSNGWNCFIVNLYLTCTKSIASRPPIGVTIRTGVRVTIEIRIIVTVCIACNVNVMSPTECRTITIVAVCGIRWMDVNIVFEISISSVVSKRKDEGSRWIDVSLGPFPWLIGVTTEYVAMSTNYSHSGSQVIARAVKCLWMPSIIRSPVAPFPVTFRRTLQAGMKPGIQLGHFTCVSTYDAWVIEATVSIARFSIAIVVRVMVTLASKWSWCVWTLCVGITVMTVECTFIDISTSDSISSVTVYATTSIRSICVLTRCTAITPIT